MRNYLAPVLGKIKAQPINSLRIKKAGKGWEEMNQKQSLTPPCQSAHLDFYGPQIAQGTGFQVLGHKDKVSSAETMRKMRPCSGDVCMLRLSTSFLCKTGVFTRPQQGLPAPHTHIPLPCGFFFFLIALIFNILCTFLLLFLIHHTLLRI